MGPEDAFFSRADAASLPLRVRVPLRTVWKLRGYGAQSLKLHESAVCARADTRGCLGIRKNLARVPADDCAKVASVQVHELSESHFVFLECAREALLRCHGSAS